MLIITAPRAHYCTHQKKCTNVIVQSRELYRLDLWRSVATSNKSIELQSFGATTSTEIEAMKKIFFWANLVPAAVCGARCGGDTHQQTVHPDAAEAHAITLEGVRRHSNDGHPGSEHLMLVPATTHGEQASSASGGLGRVLLVDEGRGGGADNRSSTTAV